MIKSKTFSQKYLMGVKIIFIQVRACVLRGLHRAVAQQAADLPRGQAQHLHRGAEARAQDPQEPAQSPGNTVIIMTRDQ